MIGPVEQVAALVVAALPSPLHRARIDQHFRLVEMRAKGLRLDDRRHRHRPGQIEGPIAHHNRQWAGELGTKTANAAGRMGHVGLRLLLV